jgi:hypothetical protein
MQELNVAWSSCFHRPALFSAHLILYVIKGFVCRANTQIDLLKNPGRPTRLASYKARRRRKGHTRDASSTHETNGVVFRCFLCLRSMTLNREFSGSLRIVVGGILSRVDGIQAQHFEISLAGHACFGSETILIAVGEVPGDFTCCWRWAAHSFVEASGRCCYLTASIW